jgi:hypothetical protein
MNALDCWNATVESETCRPSSLTFSGEALSRRTLVRLNAIDPSILPLFDPPARVGRCVARATATLWGSIASIMRGRRIRRSPEEPILFNKAPLHRRPERRYKSYREILRKQTKSWPS